MTIKTGEEKTGMPETPAKNELNGKNLLINSDSMMDLAKGAPSTMIFRPVWTAFRATDLVVWDPTLEKTITAKTQQSAIDYNVFEGQTVKGLPRFTLSRGVMAIEEGTVKTREGHGQFVAREPYPAVAKALSTWKELVAPRKVERSGIPASGV
jgi:hypothetical protein